jgi:hypothetical protein
MAGHRERRSRARGRMMIVPARPPERKVARGPSLVVFRQQLASVPLASVITPLWRCGPSSRGRENDRGGLILFIGLGLLRLLGHWLGRRGSGFKRSRLVKIFPGPNAEPFEHILVVCIHLEGER